MTDAERIAQLQRDCWHLISIIEFMAEATGEGPELEDAALMEQIKSDLPPEVREELPGALAAQGL